MNTNINHNAIECFSHNVSYLRKRHNISKKKMAEILNIGVSSLNKIEQGIIPPRLSAKIVFRIQDYFGIPASIQLSIKIEKQIEKDPSAYISQE